MMALDGLMVNKLVKELQILVDARIQKISQVGNNDFLLTVRNTKNAKLFISLDRNKYRIALTEYEYQSPSSATMFTMFLRKHLEGGFIKSITQYDLDRIVTFEISKVNEFGDRTTKKLIIELMGKNSNLIVCDSNNQIIDALKKIGISDTGRTIMPRAIYEYPPITRINLLTADSEEIADILATKVHNYQDLMSLFSGISPLFAKYLVNHHAPLSLIEAIKEDQIIPATFFINEKKEFYFIPLAEQYEKYPTISLLLENYFYQKTIETLVLEKSNNLYNHINHTIIKLNNKIAKLNEELEQAKQADKWRQYGELIINNLYQIKASNAKEITLYDYSIDKEVTIELDTRYSIKENANRFFNKYQKNKKAINYISEQIQLASEESEYLEVILSQIKTASVKDIEEIKDELVANHYLKKADNQAKKRKEKIEILTYYTSDNTAIYVGKNNLQNEYLTHHLAKANNYWFHVKDGPGSHVVLAKNEGLTEEDIRSAALLAAYFSKYQNSSSVAVNYTQIRNVKKIPGKRNCFVTYTGEKTIYIDPSIELINQLKRK